MKITNPEKLAKLVIETYLTSRRLPKIKANEVAPELTKQGACFVTVYVGSQLRGCIGSWRAFEPLYQNIIRHAIDAVSLDFRFPAITKAELPKLKIEVSVLTPPKRWQPKNKEEMLAFLGKIKPGLVLEKAGQRALFLPQVWDDLPNPADFLSHLALKAGLKETVWQEPGVKFWIFRRSS